MSVAAQYIMVLDDSEDITNAFKMALEAHGFKVNAFLNPYLALDDFQSNPEKYSLIISDIRMPKMTGLEFAAKIREISDTIKIVLMTAYEIKHEIHDELNKLISKDKGSFVQKPISIEDLISIVGRDLGLTKKVL